MALGISRATGIIAGVCALIAIVWLPPKPRTGTDDRLMRGMGASDPGWQLRREVALKSQELSLAAEGLRFLQRRDSLAPALADREGTVLTAAAPDVPDDWRAWLAEQTVQVQESMGAGAVGARVLSALFVDTSSWHAITRLQQSPEQRTWQSWANSTVTAFGSAAAPFSCITIHDLRRSVASGGRRVLMRPERFQAPIGFGICRFFATYGEPGPAVRSWLRDGAWRFGMTEEVRYPNVFSQPSFVRQTTFTYFSNAGQLALGSCIEGSTSGCRTWLLTPDRQRFPQLDDMPAYVAAWRGVWYGDGLLDGLEREMGLERMRTFWTSPLALDSAFASAFDVDMGTWVYGWLDRQFGPLPHEGPRLPDYAVTVLLAGLLVAFGAAKAHARNVR
jgi:hypothetical protein